MDIKFGLKLWSTDTDLIDPAVQLLDRKIFDYIELFVIPDTQISPFMVDVPYIIHIPHHKFGVNIGEAGKKEYNLQKIAESARWADELNAKYLILHAGHGSMEDALDMLHEITDSRILIENMPKVGLDNEVMIGYSPDQMEELMNPANRGLCLDFGHAIKASISLKIDYKEYINKFLYFKPEVFHISDGMLTGEKDEHLNIGEGEYDFGYLLGRTMLDSSKLITLETPRMNQQNLQEDVHNINFLKNSIEFI